MLNLGAQYFRQLSTIAAISIVLLITSAPVSASVLLPVDSGESSVAVELPQDMTREEVRDLVARMSDDQVRELIITQLDKLADQAQSTNVDTGAVYIRQLTKGFEVAADSLRRIFTSGGDVYALPISMWQQITDNGSISGWYLLFQLLGLMLVGLAIERMVKYLLRNIGRNFQDVDSASETIAVVLLKAVLGLV